MKKGEKGILLGIVVGVFSLMAFNVFNKMSSTEKDPGIPFFSNASAELSESSAIALKKLKCRSCHSLWTLRDIMKNGSVPAPPLDGIGSLRSEQWLFDYLSAVNPQEMFAKTMHKLYPNDPLVQAYDGSRLKKEFQMPSYAEASIEDRQVIAAYLSSLKVEDWYLDEIKKTEYKKLFGQVRPEQNPIQ